MKHQYHPIFDSNQSTPLAGYRVKWNTGCSLPNKSCLGGTKIFWGSNGNGGRLLNGDACYLGSAHVGNEVIPGYVDQGDQGGRCGAVYGLNGTAYEPYVVTFDIFPMDDVDKVEWIRVGDCNNVVRPVIGGYDCQGNPLYHAIGWHCGASCRFLNGWVIGKTGCLGGKGRQALLPFNGKEHCVTDYWVLCWKENQGAYANNSGCRR
ncbi:hypothetical protein RQP46_010129 [Phenoliferia psychrophenolica]